MPLLERFLRYVAIDSQADPDARGTPSSPGQRRLADLLRTELTALGFDAAVDDHAYVTARLPARHAPAAAPTIGLIAHLDTSPDASGAGVRPRVVRDYDGGAVDLGGTLRLDPALFPVLSGKKGKTLVVTDGATLLGADNKAGIAIIMTILERLQARPDLACPGVAVAFTPDEEIGHGAELLDIPAFGADFAYTVDGGAVGEIEYENFNAARADLVIHGLSIHPGDAKGKMVNAVLLGQAFLDELPPAERPENTEGREGFYHVDAFTGDVSAARLSLLVRDHDADLFQAKKDFLAATVARLNARWPAPDGDRPRFTLTVTDQYRNMVEKVRPRMDIVDSARAAMRAVGITPVDKPIRGGTDGAQLSWRGLPCPNLFTGGYNMHGPYEFAVVEEMNLAVETILGILDRYAGKGDSRS